MTRLVEIKIRLTPDLKKRLEHFCREAGTTMTSHIVWLIQSALTATQKVSLTEQPDEASSPEGHAQSSMVAAKRSASTEILEMLGALSLRVEKLVEAHPKHWIEDWASRRAERDGQALAQLSRKQSDHFSHANEAVKNLRSHITEVGQLATFREPPFFRDYKIWTVFAAGALSIVLAMALLPGESSIARFLAEKMVGGANPLTAAQIIAGGDTWRGRLIVETTALMKEESFAESFAHCVEQAKRKLKPSSCRVDFPILVETR